jgi:hypothetical protein
VNARYISSPRRCSCTTTADLELLKPRAQIPEPAHRRAIDGVDHVSRRKPPVARIGGAVKVDATTTTVGTRTAGSI